MFKIQSKITGHIMKKAIWTHTWEERQLMETSFPAAFNEESEK